MDSQLILRDEANRMVRGLQSSACERIAVIAWLTIVAVVWGVVRSGFLREGNPESINGLSIPVWVSVLFMLLFVFPVIRMARTMPDLFWLLGASVTVGLLPSVPLMPYVREGVHLVLLVGAVAIIVRREPFFPGLRQSSLVQLYVAYLGICILSIAINQVLGGDVWQLKVGIAELILYVAFAVVLSVLATYANRDMNLLTPLIDGFLWAVFVQATVAAVAIVLVVVSPYSAGNDTVFGMGYFDRMKTTFSGPDHAGVFFAASIPLVILWANQRQERIARTVAMVYLQLAPWFVIATGLVQGVWP